MVTIRITSELFPRFDEEAPPWLFSTSVYPTDETSPDETSPAVLDITRPDESGCFKSCHPCDTQCESRKTEEDCFYLKDEEINEGSGEYVDLNCDEFHWAECSNSCGGGESFKLGFLNGEIVEQKRRCNVEPCPIEIKKMNECSPCEYNVWLCHSEDCQLGETCQRVSHTNDEYRCLPNTIGECMAWGNLHVVTFDGAYNDVYGIGYYTFMELNHSAFENELVDQILVEEYYYDDNNTTLSLESLPNFTIVMQTARPNGQLSAVERLYINVNWPTKVC